MTKPQPGGGGGGSNSRRLFSHGSGVWSPKIRVAAWSAPSGLQMGLSVAAEATLLCVFLGQRESSHFFLFSRGH